jgi:hypothetical protein
MESSADPLVPNGLVSSRLPLLAEILVPKELVSRRLPSLADLISAELYFARARSLLESMQAGLIF